MLRGSLMDAQVRAFGHELFKIERRDADLAAVVERIGAQVADLDPLLDESALDAEAFSDVFDGQQSEHGGHGSVTCKDVYGCVIVSHHVTQNPLSARHRAFSIVRASGH
jgi:hypothetical protein